MSVKIFLSTVSDEFRVYRDQLRGDLTRQNVEVKVQEDFKDLGGDTLDKVDVYIAHCDAVVHLVGEMTGSEPFPDEKSGLLTKYPDLPLRLPPLGKALQEGVALSYTQWEAWLARYHKKLLFIAEADPRALRAEKFTPTDASRAAQAAHLARIKAVGRFPSCVFRNVDDLAKHVALTGILDLLAKAQAQAPVSQPRNLPFASLGTLFKGRDKFMEELHAALGKGTPNAVAVVRKALHGLGGVGKTRLAIEYALHHAEEYSALLFVPADTPEKLNAGMAALAGVLDLPEKDQPRDEVKIRGALKWLAAHPTWLMILDSVDDAAAANAAEDLIAKLQGGHVLIAGRNSNYGSAIRSFQLDTLPTEEAAAFLLERAEKRECASNDEELARELANELGGLALGLSQAGAYIDTQRTSFARYLKLWRGARTKVVNWFDRRLVSYNHNVGLAATWIASVEELTPQGRFLLELCAFLGPTPIPMSLLEALDATPMVLVRPDGTRNWISEFEVLMGRSPLEAGGVGASEVLGDLFAYSLVR